MTKQQLPPPVNRLEQLKRQVGSAIGLGNEGRKISVPLALLDEDPANERKTFRKMEGLAASIKAFGVLEPPTAFEKAGGRYQLLTGHRRFRAAKLAGLNQIEIIVRKADEEKTIRKKSIVSNVQREDVNPIELANALQSLLDDGDAKTQTALAETVGKDKFWVSKMLRILDLPAAIQKKVATSQLLVSYDAVAEIARMKDHHHQVELIDFLLDGASVKEVRERIRETKNGDEPTVKKPKRVFDVATNVSVIVQAKTARLTNDQVVEALTKALAIAKKTTKS